jgi:hypothetical protein
LREIFDCCYNCVCGIDFTILFHNEQEYSENIKSPYATSSHDWQFNGKSASVPEFHHNEYSGIIGAETEGEYFNENQGKAEPFYTHAKSY